MSAVAADVFRRPEMLASGKNRLRTPDISSISDIFDTTRVTRPRAAIAAHMTTAAPDPTGILITQFREAAAK
jgi:hypothetical protein